MVEEKIKIEGFNCRMIRSDIENIKTPIIFLHGYFFTSEVWKRIGILDTLEGKGIPFKAIDMPYGAKSDCEPKTSDPEVNVNIVKKLVKEKPLIVGASLGGYIALKYTVKYSVKGLLLIAPVRSLETELLEAYEKLNVKTFIIYGENDDVVSIDEMKTLSSHLNAELIVYKNAGHPAYLDEPVRFKNDLIRLYEEIESGVF